MCRTLGPKWVEQVFVAGALLAQALGPKVDVCFGWDRRWQGAWPKSWS